jgi:glycosyltransferase involved in cell wall biosynthesis
MKVVIVTSFPFPDGKATANRVRVFAEELVRSGIADEVQIVATITGQGGIENFSENINVVRLPAPMIDKNKLISRAISEMLIAFKLWSITKKLKADLLIVTVPSALLLLPIAIFPKHVKLVLDVRDAVWTYFPKGSLKGLFGALLRRLFRIAAKKADLVCVTNTHEATSVAAVAGVKAIVVANGISEARVNDFQSIVIKPLRGKVNITYIGNVGIAQELDILINFCKVHQNNIEVNVVGDGAKLTGLKAKAIDENIMNITFHGAVSFDSVARYMEEADILFAQIGKNFQSAIPTKVFEYIAAGRKVLLGLPEGAAKDTFENFHGVEIFPVGSFTCMKQSYQDLIIQRFGDEERILNLELLKSRYIREKTMTALLASLNNI